MEVSTSLYTQPQKQEAAFIGSAREFWLGTKRLPQTIEVATSSGVPAILVKKQGDYPAFWDKDSSFIETMKEFYQRVKTKNQTLI